MPPRSRPNDSPQAVLGRRIRDARVRGSGNKGKRRSQEALADDPRLDVHRTYVGQVERGEVNIALSNLLRFAAALEVNPGDLVIDLKPE